jgi:hypothetical protein
MVEQAVDFLVIFNFIILIGLVAVLKWLSTKGKLKLNENKLARILSGYFSFSSITTSLPLLKINVRGILIMDIVFLLIIWSIGYLWFRWLYRRLSSRNLP